MQVLVAPDDTADRLRDHVRSHPELVHDDYQDHVDGDPIKQACYLLSEAYFHACGGEDSELEVYRLGWDDVDPAYEGAHWFLRRGEDVIIDLSLPAPTDGDNVPWEVARHRAFITGYTPSNRTQRVLAALDIDY
jgi:hypothetical protein